MQRLKNLIYDVVGRMSTVGDPIIQQKTLLLIKTDEIGDYVLWRNVLTCIRRSSAFRDHRIALLGNAAWKGLATTFDRDEVDEFIWLDKKKFKSDMLYRFRFLKAIRKRGFEKVVNCIFSRSPRVDDAIVNACQGYKIGMVRNEHNVAVFEKGYDKDLYQELHELPLTGLFEFERNKAFASAFTREKCEPDFGFQREKFLRSPVDLSDYAVIFPGSGRADRRWPIGYFAEVARYLHGKQLQVVLAGGPGDVEACAELRSTLDFGVTDVSGKTSLSQFVSLLSAARLLVSVDTGAVHLAAAAGCPVFGLFTGSQYGRFAPYPAGIAEKPFHTIYPDEFENELSSQAEIGEKYQYFSPFQLSSIPPEKVIAAISKYEYDK